MKEAIRHGYHAYGGLRSPDKKYFYLGIPKNASTYISNILLANNWHYHTLGDDSEHIEHAMVVLKDPVDRWVSGVATYITSWILGPAYGSDHFLNNYNELSERLLFETQILDDHTTPQARYVAQLNEKIPNVPVTFFKLNHALLQSFSNCVNQEITTSNVDANVSEDHYDQRAIVDFLKNRLREDFSLRAKIVARFQEDYKLINSVQFYYDPR